MNENNLFHVERKDIDNLYNEKITELNEVLSKISSAEFNTQTDAFKENIDINSRDDYIIWQRNHNIRIQSLQRFSEILLNLRDNMKSIYNKLISDYDKMNNNTMRPLYTDNDISNLNRDQFTQIYNFYNSQVVPQINMANQAIQFGGRSNKSNHSEMNMKDIKELCKANQIKLSKVVNDKRVVYKKKELITKLKRKKLI